PRPAAPRVTAGSRGARSDWKKFSWVRQRGSAAHPLRLRNGMRRRLTLALLVVTMAAPTSAAADPIWPGSPTEAVRRHIEETIGIAVDRRLDVAARQEAARVEVARSFDFDELSRRALGEHWSRMTATERRDATAGVRAMVTSVYTSRMTRDLGARMGSLRER